MTKKQRCKYQKLYSTILFILLFVLVNFSLTSCRYRDCCLNSDKKILMWRKHQESLLKIKNYQFHGVITYCMSQPYWRHISFICQKIDNKSCRLIFINPIGWKNFEINILEDEKCDAQHHIKNCFSIDCFERILKKLLNLDISYKNFTKWIVGLPGKEYSYTLNIHGYLKSISCHCNENLIILYKNYYNDMIPMLPKFIKIFYNNDHYFNIKIYNWKIL